jgi:hypothetical protein
MKENSRKYLLNTQNPAPHTGKLLSDHIKKHRIRQNALARALNRQTGTLISFRKNATLQTAILWELCHALKHNFFADIAHQLPTDYPTSLPDTTTDPLQLQIQDLQQQIARLTHERDLLQQIIQNWGKR